MFLQFFSYDLNNDVTLYAFYLFSLDHAVLN